MTAAHRQDYRYAAVPFAAPASGLLLDSRFRSLTGEAAWATLPEPVRKRFSKRIAPGTPSIYRGEVLITELSPAGRVLANLARFIGGPLPLDNGATGPTAVTVTEDTGAAGQTWTRSYSRRRGAPQVICSMKCFRGPTGLEESVGAGFGMALRVSVHDGALHFRCDHYFWRMGRLRLRLPSALCPGDMEIVHTHRPDGTFSFSLTLIHARFGRLLHQYAVYRDP